MPQRQTYDPGTPSWVDYVAPDLDAGAQFYCDLFDWTVTAEESAETTRGYRKFLRGGRYVAGLGLGRPPMWTTYVSVADADVVAKTVEAHGGAVLSEPQDVADLGRRALFADPEGARFAVSQPGERNGAELVNEPGSFCWSELACRDVEAAKTFYGAVFGWDGTTTSIANDTSTYTEFRLADSGGDGESATPDRGVGRDERGVACRDTCALDGVFRYR
ncbi:MAG TPA: VOC family protein [Acidimicrobiales bacterium]|jgi:hypothetical protein